MSTLRDVKIGKTVTVVKLWGEGAVKRRIMDMGITKGVKVTVRKVAPLGDPIEITVRGTYHSFGQFLNDLTQLSRIITIHDFVVSPSQKNPDLLEMTVLVKTYKYNPAAQDNLKKEENNLKDKKKQKKIKETKNK